MPDLTTVVNDLSEHQTDGSPRASRRAISDSLTALRALLHVEVAFVSRFAEGRRWFEFLDSDDSFRPFRVGDSDVLDATYCARVVDGRVDRLIVDASRVPELRSLPVTTALPIGGHLSVPIAGEDGEPTGTLCCFSRTADPDLRQRDLELMTVFAGMIGRHMRLLLRWDRCEQIVRERVAGVLDAGGPAIALQPIVEIRTGRVAGYEALSRFPRLDGWTPDRWFREAELVGLGVELESIAVCAALRRLPTLPGECSLSVNVSAAALCRSDSLMRLLDSCPPGRVVVELTEHAQVEDYDELVRALARVREAGARVAVDDAGSGYAGLEHVLRLQPEVLKLDRSLVGGVSTHEGRQALCEAMVGFTERTGSVLVAEGVETADDLETLAGIGVRLAQGYHLGRPELRAAPE